MSSLSSSSGMGSKIFKSLLFTTHKSRGGATSVAYRSLLALAISRKTGENGSVFDLSIAYSLRCRFIGKQRGVSLDLSLFPSACFAFKNLCCITNTRHPSSSFAFKSLRCITNIVLLRPTVRCAARHQKKRRWILRLEEPPMSQQGPFQIFMSDIYFRPAVLLGTRNNSPDIF